jgi:signal transduction histidine kinase
MKRSFRLRVFLANLTCVLIFIFASRVAVHNTVSEPLLNYFSETLAHHLVREIENAKDHMDAATTAAHLEMSFDDIRPGELVVTLPSQSASPSPLTAHLLKAIHAPELIWTPLQNQNADRTVEMTQLTDDGVLWKVLRAQSHSNGWVYVAVQRAVMMRSFDEVLKVRDAVFVVLIPLLMIFVLVITIAMSYAALNPIVHLQKSFTQIQIHKNDTHISETKNYKEFEDFIHYFNALIDRLRASYAQAARFSSDAAHELRTPLTIIRGHLHKMVNQFPDGSETQVELSLVAEEVERLISISNKLLMLSQADAGRINLTQQEINFNDFLGQMLDDLKTFNPDLVFSKNIQPGLRIQGDPDLMMQLMMNLFGNAIKYNYPQGRIEVKAHTVSNELIFSISNTTHLIMAGLDERVFERFYRHREAINHQVSEATGAGLGLSLCREIVMAHGGRIRLLKDGDQWVTFECALPLS